MELDKATTALVLIDLQEGILGFDTAPLAASEIKSAAMKLIAKFRAVGAPVVFVRLAFAPTFADALQQPVDRALMGSELPENFSDMPKDFNISSSDILITKHQWGAFYGTELDLQLRRRGIKTIVLGGIATNIGVESTARDAYERNYGLIFAEGAITGLDTSMHDFAMEMIFPLLGRVRGVDEIVGSLG